MKRKFGIRTRFILILVFITLVPLLITGYILTKINEQSIKLQTKEFQLSISVQLTELTHSILNNSCSELNEIAQILKIKASSARSLYVRGKQKLIRRMENEEE